MEAKNLIQTGDVFANEWKELTVVSVRSADDVKVERLDGSTTTTTARKLIEIGAKETGKKPISVQ